MSGQAGKLQPGGQIVGGHSLGSKSFFLDPTRLWLLVALILLVIPFNRGGLWDPYELRIAEFARRLAVQLFRAPLPGGFGAGERVTASQLGQGELGITSPALAFAVLGVSDWAGRLASLFWALVAMISLWYLMGRLVGRFSQVMSVLVLVSLPLFAWQARSMLGEAPTMATTALAMAGLLLVMFDEAATHDQQRVLIFRPYLHVSMALLGLAAGILCRGVLLGVAVPCLAVGMVGVATLSNAPQQRIRRRAAVLTLSTGVLAALLGLGIAWSAPTGYSRLLAANLANRGSSMSFDAVFTTLAHELFPLSTFLPIAAAIALYTPSPAVKGRIQERATSLALLWSILLSTAAAAVMSYRSVVAPFSGTVAAAGVAGLAIARIHRREVSSALVGVLVLTVASTLLGDFINFPDKIMLMTGMLGAHLPLGFQADNQLWVVGAFAAIVVGCIAAVMPPTNSGVEAVRAVERYRAVYETLQRAFSGQLVSALVLVETALGTTALLDRANSRGWISASFFDLARSLVGPLLGWAWLLPPLVFVALPFGYVTVDIALGWVARFGSRVAPFLLPILADPRGAHAGTRSTGIILGVALIVSGLVLTLGHGAAIAEQLSPKRAILQYRERAKANEPLAVLGVKSEALGFYVSAPPKTIDDIGVAARWLSEAPTQRRWLAFGSDRLAEVNGAYRAVSERRNLGIVDNVVGNLILGTNRVEANERDYNPLSLDVLAVPPSSEHAASIQFGQFCRLLGWEVRGGDGAPTNSLVVGTVYEFRLVFQVLGTTDYDWQIFIHIDGHGRRHNGDHDPVMGRYPTTLWQSGDIIVDRHPIAIDRGSFLGEHVVYMGLYRGNKRLDVTSGQSDDDRVRIGTLTIE